MVHLLSGAWGAALRERFFPFSPLAWEKGSGDEGQSIP